MDFTQEEKNALSKFNESQIMRFNALVRTGKDAKSAFNVVNQTPVPLMTPVEEQSRGVVGAIKDIPSDILQTGREILSGWENRAGNIAELGALRQAGQRSWLGTTLKQAGQLAGSAADTIGNLTTGVGRIALSPKAEERAGEIIQQFGSQVAQTEPVQALIGWYDGLDDRQKEAVDAAGGVLSLAGEFVGAGGVSRGASAVSTAGRTATTAARQTGESLANRLRQTGSSLATNTVDNVIDTATEGVVRAVDAVRQIPASISNRAKQAVDRRIVRVATENPEKALDEITNLYKKGIVPGVKGKNKTLSSISKIEDSVRESVPRLAKLTDDIGEYLYNVENIQDFATAINSEERRIWSQISQGIQQAGQSGKLIDTKPIVDELTKLLSSERASLSTQLKNTIQRKIAELSEVAADGSIVSTKQITPQGAQDFLADLNNGLQSYYRGSTAGTNADVIVDTLVANNLRKNLDEVVNSLDDTTFRELKRQYGQLKDMEKDVVHRAVFEAQKGDGLSRISDIMSAADIGAGLLDPTFLARGVSQFLTKEVIQSLSDKDELIRQMWNYAKNISDISQ